MKARVYVTLKPGVLDPQGKAIQHSVALLGYDGVADVRQGKYFELDIDAAGVTNTVSNTRATPCLRCSARLDIPDRASRRIAAYRSTRERGCVIGGTPDVSTPWARLSAPGHRPGER